MNYQTDYLNAVFAYYGLYLVGRDIYTVDTDEYVGIVENVEIESNRLIIRTRRPTALNSITVTVHIGED